jgi:serine/threonine protein kinase
MSIYEKGCVIGPSPITSNSYELNHFISKGSWGNVWKCINNQTQEICAIKIIPDIYELEDYHIIYNELCLLYSMNNSDNRIIQIKDHMVIDSTIYIIFEYMNFDLETLCNKFNLTLDNICNILYQILQSIDYLHQHNIIHRDIKPQNILINYNTELQSLSIKLCDLGLSTIYSDNLKGDHVVTRWYRAPEIILNCIYDSSIDIWSIGCIFAEMLLKLIDLNKNKIHHYILLPGICDSCTSPKNNEISFNLKHNCEQLVKIIELYGSNKIIELYGNDKISNLESMKLPHESLKLLTSVNIPQNKSIDDLIPISDKTGIDLNVINLLKKMLEFNPSDRITAKEALLHPLF